MVYEKSIALFLLFHKIWLNMNFQETVNFNCLHATVTIEVYFDIFLQFFCNPTNYSFLSLLFDIFSHLKCQHIFRFFFKTRQVYCKLTKRPFLFYPTYTLLFMYFFVDKVDNFVYNCFFSIISIFSMWITLGFYPPVILDLFRHHSDFVHYV